MFERHFYLKVTVSLAILTQNAFATILISGSENWGATDMNQDIQVLSGGSLTVNGLFRIINGHTLTVENGGQIIVNARVDFDAGGTLIMNGGSASFNDTVKFPDNNNGSVYIYLYGGLLTCHDTESYASRGSELHVGGGVMRTGQISESRRDPAGPDWNIQPIAPYQDIVITDLGGGVKEVAAATPTIEVQFALAESGDFETLTPVSIDVVLSEPVGETVTAYYFITGGSALGGGVDYTVMTSGTITFDPYQTLGTISIDITDDGADEEDETILLELYLVIGGEVQLGTNTSHTYTIIDPRPAVQFSSTIARGKEEVTPANINVELSHNWQQTVTIDYSVTGGTASAGTDYVLADVTLTFDPCETIKNIEIAIIDDELDEGSETIIITLSNPTGNSRMGANSQHTFTITEDIPLLKTGSYFRSDSDPTARVGPHPDVIVPLGFTDNSLIFRRNQGFAPVWSAEGIPEIPLPVAISRANCETTVNTFSRVSIVETNPARTTVHWRYVRDCDNIAPTSWVDEYFTVYPEGVCIRTIKDAAATSISQWNSNTPVISNMQLLPEGIAALSAEWLNPAVLSVDSGDYTYDGFNQQRRCYELQCDVTGDPTSLDLTLDTSGGQSIHNPVIVLKNWGDAEPRILTNGERPQDYYIGYAADMYGDHLVIWLGIETSDSADISITPVGASGQFVDRALPPDFGYDFDTDVPPLPMGSPEPGKFGAYYTHLKFNNRFDELWRVGDHADIVVQFDDNAHRFVFWRGTNYGPHWASDTTQTPYSNWYGTQFVERRASEWGYDGCCAEPMQDWDCRYAHARIISSNPARAIVQWRYASCDRNLDIVRDGSGDIWGDWDEEYFTIYPDAISVRKVTAYSSRTGGSDMESPHIEYFESIPVTNPGTIPEDNIHWNSLSATDYFGGKKDWIAQDVDGGAMTNLDQITNRPIMVVRMKGSTVPFSIVEGSSVEHDPVGQHDCRPFNAYDDWPAWPRDDRSMGGWLWDEDPATHCYRKFWTKYPSHCSILHVKWQDYEHLVNVKRTKIMLFGMYDGAEAANVNHLIPLARSWEYAPTLTITGTGFSGGAYDKTERAYRISRDSQDAGELEFTVNASYNSPVHNMCLVIEDWQQKVRLTINGQPVASGPDFRQGIETSADQTSSLVVWIKRQSTSSMNVVISEPLPGDFDADGDIDYADLEGLVANWLAFSAGFHPVKGNVNNDNRVNFLDFALCASNWLEQY